MSLPKKEEITTAFLVKNDGKIVWMRDDYLESRTMLCKGELRDLLDRVAEVKQQAKENGVRFEN